eukprot:gene9832-10841_t
MAEKQGYTVIPASQRPDGTWRKEIKVKAGYVPPDEAERYQSRGKQWASKTSNLPPGMAPDDTAASVTVKSKNQKKNERKKQKRKEQNAGLQSNDDDSPVSSLSSDVKSLAIGERNTADNSEATDKISKEVLGKKIKGLKKKLRQIEELENKLSSGQVKELTKEQIEKVARKKQLSDELEDLELDLKLCD